MEERDAESGATEETRFLPPQPAGPEPELGDRPQPQAPQAPPPPQQAYGYPPAPPGQAYTPPPGQAAGGQQPYPPPPPGQPYYPPPPPGYGYPPAPGHPYPPPWGYGQPPVPDNGQAVAGFILSLVSLGLLVISLGLSSIVSIGCAIAGIILGRNGKRKVDAGETPKHAGLAQAGYIIGWVSLVLSVLVTISWIVFVIVAASNSDSNDSDGLEITAVVSVLRATGAIVGA